MPRVPVYTDQEGLSEDQLKVFKEIEQSRGKVVGVFTVLLSSPRVAQLAGELGAYMRFDTVLPAPVRELTILAALREFDAQFEWGYHEEFARQAEVSEDAISAIKFDRALDQVPETEAQVIRYARELFRVHRVSDATFEALQSRLGDQGMVELTTLLGYYAMVSAALNAFQVPATPGKAILPPR